ncbi:MAG: Rpn family recombination-promoting nuclease/putative transposase [Blastocatellia bacterium]
MMNAEISNPHDSFFKERLSRPEMAADFLANYLPPEILAILDVSEPEIVKDSFVDEELRQHFSDLLYRVKLKRGGDAYVCVLFEHKSGPDRWVAFQLLRYEVRFWESERRKGVEQLPLIFPLVFYHGQERWNVSRNFSALFDIDDLSEIRKYLPDFEHHLHDVSVYSEDRLKGTVLLRVWLLLLKHIFSNDLPEKLEEILRLLFQAERQTAIEYFFTVLRYLSAAAHPPTITELKESLAAAIPEQESGFMQSFAEAWIQEGIEKGRQQEAASVALRLLQCRFGILEAETQQRIRILPLDRLDQLVDTLLDLPSRDDLAAWLREHENGDAQ